MMKITALFDVSLSLMVVVEVEGRVGEDRGVQTRNKFMGGKLGAITK